MGKKYKSPEEAKACEIIELAIDDVKLLTRAFDTISAVCGSSRRRPSIDMRQEKRDARLIN